MPSWIPGYALLDGPEQTGVPYRYRARRERDQAAAWIRVDGHAPDSLRETSRLARVYEATVQLRLPELPAVLSSGESTVKGRPFVAYHSEDDEASPAGETLGEAELLDVVRRLATAQLTAYEAGFAGIHLAPVELARLRLRRRPKGGPLPVREWLAEPRSTRSRPALSGLEPSESWEPFTAPEVLDSWPGVSVRQALSFRLAAQISHIGSGNFLEDPSALELGPLRSLEPLVRRALEPQAARRPDLSRFLLAGLGLAA